MPRRDTLLVRRLQGIIGGAVRNGTASPKTDHSIRISHIEGDSPMRSKPRSIAHLMTLATLFCFCALVAPAQPAEQGQTSDPVTGRENSRGASTQKSDMLTDFLSRARVEKVLPPQNDPVRLWKPHANLGDLDLADLQDPIPQGMPIVVYELPDDATVLRNEGGVAAADPDTAIIYQEILDEGVGLFGLLQMGDFDGGAAAGGNFHAFWMQFASWKWNGTGSITGYDLLVFNSSLNSGNADVRMSLWDGDPLGFFDTDCTVGGIPSPIPGTTTTFSDLPQAIGSCPSIQTGIIPNEVDNDPGGITAPPGACAGLYRLKATLPAPAQITDCQTAWMVLELLEGCRLAWRFGGPADDSEPPLIGTPLGWILSANNVDGAGEPLTCCRTGVACTAANAAAVCGHSSMCTDGSVDTLLGGFTDETTTPPYYASFVAGAYAQAERALFLKPASADFPPETNPTPDGWTINGNEIILEGGGRPIWLEGWISDWDPHQEGILLKAWSIDLETAGFTTGTGDDLERYVVPCQSSTECAPLGAASTCQDDGTCYYIYLDNSRLDYVFHGYAQLAGVIDSGFSLRSAASARDEDVPSPGTDSYAVSFVLWVPANASGTYKLDIEPIGSYLIDDDSQFIPLIELQSVKVTVVDCDNVAAPQMEQPVVPKNRYLSFTPSNPGVSTAHRVTFEDLPGVYASLNGAQMWIGPPGLYCHNSGQAKEPPGGCGPAPGQPSRYFYGATLQCQPFYMDWHGTCPAGFCVGGLREGSACAADDDCAETIHVFHENIVPAGGLPGSAGSIDPAIYHVQAILEACSLAAEENYSTPLVLNTSKWGDTVGDCSSLPCSSPDGVVNVSSDVIALLDRFKNQATGASKPRADLVGQSGPAGRPDVITTIIDVTKGLDAFRGVAYPEPPGPRPCE